MKVASIAELRKLHSCMSSGPGLLGKWNGHTVAHFHGESFRVLGGCVAVTPGLYQTAGLSINEGYELFLLNLDWEPSAGWKSPLHALAATELVNGTT